MKDDFVIKEHSIEWKTSHMVFSDLTDWTGWSWSWIGLSRTTTTTSNLMRLCLIFHPLMYG